MSVGHDGRSSKVWRVLSMAVGLQLGACRCTQLSEDEALRRQLDVTAVHLYVAAKLAITGDPEAPNTERARQLILESISSVRQGVDALEAASHHADVDAAKHDQQAPAPRPLEEAKRAAALFQSLWELRALGRDQARRGPDTTLQPLLPALFGEARAGAASNLWSQLNRATDHSLLLLAMTGLKFHPKSPTPIPDELLLYEAWATNPAEIQHPLLRGWHHAVRALHYARAGYCELARLDSDASLRYPMTDGNLADAMASAARVAAHVPDVAILVDMLVLAPIIVPIAAHYSTAECFTKRLETDKALEETRRMSLALKQAGVPPSELALLDAYLAYKAGDWSQVQELLKLARDSQPLDDPSRKDLEELLQYAQQRNPGHFEKYFDQLFLATFATKLIVRHVQASQLVEHWQASALGQRLAAFATVLGRVGNAEQGLSRHGAGIWQDIKSKLGLDKD